MAKIIDVGSIGSYFESLSDPRHTRNRKHLLVDIAVIAGRILWTTPSGRDKIALIATEATTGRTLWRRTVWRDTPAGEPIP